MSVGRGGPDPIYTLRGVASPVSCLKFQNNEILSCGSYEGIIHSWSMKMRRVVDKLAAHPGQTLLWLDFINDACCMLSQARNGVLKIWTRSDTGWQEEGCITTCSTGFCNACVLSDGKLLAVPSEEQSTVDILDIASRKLVHRYQHDPTQQKLGMCMKMTPAADNRLLVGYEDGSVALWDCRQADSFLLRRKIHEDAVMCLDYCPATDIGFTGSVDDNIYSWTLAQHTDITVKSHMKVTNPGFNQCTVRDDGKLVAYTGWDGNIRLFSGKSLKPLAVLTHHKESVYCAAFSPDYILACGAKDEQISLWDIYR